MFCKNCGNQLADDAKFCNKCGTATTPAEPVIPNETSKPATDVQTKKSLAWWIILVLVLGGLVVSCTTFFLVDGFANGGKIFGSLFGNNPFTQKAEESEENELEKDNQAEESLILPNFIRKTEAEIADNYQDDFKFKIEREYKEGIEPGVIFDQNPPAGKDVKKGSEVTIKVSLGDKTLKFPNVYGKPLMQAETAIRDKGFSVDNIKIVEQTDPYIEKGCVIKSDPQADADVPASAKITLIISSGPPKDPVKIPLNLLGVKLESAESSLKNVGLLVGNVTYEYNNIYDEGYVCAISPDPTETPEVERGSKIDIVISKGDFPKVDIEILLPTYEEATKVTLVIKSDGEELFSVETDVSVEEEHIFRDIQLSTLPQTMTIYYILPAAEPDTETDQETENESEETVTEQQPIKIMDIVINNVEEKDGRLVAVFEEV